MRFTRPVLRLAAVLLCGLPFVAPAMAQPGIVLQRAVFVAGVGTGGSRVLRPAADLPRGATVVLMVEWRAPADAGGFTLATPIAPALAYQRSSVDGAEISVDGGRSWGRPGTLTVTDRDGVRQASGEDATHIRWRISPSEAAAGSGRIAYTARVR